MTLAVFGVRGASHRLGDGSVPVSTDDLNLDQIRLQLQKCSPEPAGSCTRLEHCDYHPRRPQTC